MPGEAPVFPIVVVWHATGESEKYEDKRDLLCNLESFDTSTDAHEATVQDARGRVVRLRVDITSGSVDVELADPAVLMGGGNK